MDNSNMIRIIEVRLKEMGKSKKQFYEETGISSATYSQWNTGMFAPSKKKIEAVSSYIGVPVSELTGEEQKEKPPAHGGELSTEAEELIRLFDLASPELRAAALAVLRSAEVSGTSQGVGPAKK